MAPVDAAGAAVEQVIPATAGSGLTAMPKPRRVRPAEPAAKQAVPVPAVPAAQRVGLAVQPETTVPAEPPPAAPAMAAPVEADLMQ